MKESVSRRSFVTAAAGFGAVAAGFAGVAYGDESGQAQSGVDMGKTYECNVTPFPNWHCGSPGIECDPTNPDRMVYVSTATTPWNTRWHFSMGQAVFYSTDRGTTWNQAAFPFGVYPGGGVCTLSVDNDGRFYLFWNALRAPDPADDAYASRINPMLMSTSTDGGATWSEPVETPYVVTGRPHSRIDKATGKYYVVGAKRGQWQLPLYVSVTSDLGVTFSEPRRFAYPQRKREDNGFVGFPGNQIAVHDGILATGHQECVTDSTIDESLHFTYSTDDGATWTDVPVVVDGAEVPATDFQLINYGSGPYSYNDPQPYITADPTSTGRFSLLLIRNLGASNNNDLVGFEVYTTDDCGTTWRKATVIANDGCRPWIEYGPNGELAVAWRTHHVNCYAAVSFDHGATFSMPLRINAEAQPLGDSGAQCDYWSDVAVDDKYVHVAWADCRTGGALSAIYGRAPLSAFQPMPADPIPLVERVGTPLPHKDEALEAAASK